jgi:phage gp29-like protein
LKCVRDGKNNEEVEKILNCPDMRNLLSDLLDTILWGYTVIQVNKIYFDEEFESYRIDYDLIPRKHVHPESKYQCISFQQGMITNDVFYKEAPYSKFMMWAGWEKSKGLLLSCCQYVIYKRGGFGDWAQYSEMFGMPFRDCVYPDGDETTRQALNMMNEQWGGAPYLIHPESSKISLIKDASTGGTTTLYKDLKDACNAELSKIILGNTLTTEQGQNGARSLGEVHEDTEDEKKDSDELFILAQLNTQFRKVLKTFGFDLKGFEIWYDSPGKDLKKLKDRFEIVKGVSEIVPIDDDYFYEEFDIPKPANYDVLKEQMQNEKASLNTIENVLKSPFDEKKQAKNLIQRVTSFFV